MSSDWVMQTKLKKAAEFLGDKSKGDLGDMGRYLSHQYSDGDISLLRSLATFSGAEEYREAAIDMMSKVDPESWPDPEAIVFANLEEICYEESDITVEDYSERGELENSTRVQEILKRVIGSVFRAPVDSVRDGKGRYPSAENDFLLVSPNKFKGTFRYEDYTFQFELTHRSSDWAISYRLDEKSLLKLKRDRKKK